MGLKQLQTNFSSGELGPLMDMRSDTGSYANGARLIRNAMILNQGGVVRRPGTEYLATLSGNRRLVPFEFSNEERYVFAFGNTILEIFDTSGTLLQTINGCAWTTSILFSMTYSQFGDLMIVCSPQMKIQKITRTGLSTFTVEDFLFAEATTGIEIYQPYYKYAADTTTLSVSGITGSVTLTSSVAHFTSALVGTRLRWYDNEILITAYISDTQLTGTCQKTLEAHFDIDPFRTTDGSNVVEVTHIGHGMTTGASVTIVGANGFAGISSNQLNGVRTITIIDSDKYSFVAGANASSSADGGGPHARFQGSNIATRTWDEQAFSAVRGWPGAVCFHESRLWFGGSYSIPNGLWASMIGLYNNFFTDEALDNESIQIQISSEDFSSVLHLVSNRHLQIFTATGEFYVPKGTQGGSITPTNIYIARQTPYGSSTVTPLPFDGATTFVQSSKSAVREFIYTDTQQSYNSPNLSLLAGHLIDQPVDLGISYGTSGRPEQYLYIVNQNGTIAGFLSARAEKIAAWCLWTASHSSGTANFKSVVTVGSKIYMVVERGSNYFLELQAATDLDLSIDCATTYTSGSPTDTWIVDSQYYNTTVSVVSSNYYIGDYAVDGSGNLTIDVAVDEITVGYSYTVTVETLPANVQLPDGFYSGRQKRISRAILALDSTLAVSVNGNNFILRQVTNDLSSDPVPFTGKTDFYILGYNKDATITITQTEPLPMRLLGVATEVTV